MSLVSRYLDPPLLERLAALQLSARSVVEGTTTGPNNTRIPRHGIGIKAAVGTPVRSVAAGTVSLAGPLGLYLTSVLIDHGGGYYTFYAYLNDATVRPGDLSGEGGAPG